MAGEQLWVTEGEEQGNRLSLDAGLMIGRAAPDEDGRLGGDPEISRAHARISREASGELTIEDLGSANGTFVNDERIDAPRALELGDVIRVGRTVLQLRDRSGQVPQKTRVPMVVPVGEPTSTPAAMAEELVVTAGAAAGRRLALGDELVIGRAVSGEGMLSDDHELSRRHARVARDAGGRLTIEDLGSANGTFVNGERVRDSRPLRLGDSVRVGSSTLQLTQVGQASAAPARETNPPAPAVAAPPAPATPPAVVASRSPAPAAPPPDLSDLPSALPAGSIIAGCRIEDVISHGDMAIVYRAEELALQRAVALKLIHPERSGEERFRERFRRESKVAAAIDHPNVIPIFDAGDEDGVLYLTMRLVEGTDMRTLIAAQGRIEPRRAARIIRQVGAALDAVHAHGMLHRDVKPSNVLIARQDHVYLSDFGLAKRAEAVGGLTRQGSIIARAEYVAPEQILGEQADARSDIYALGCLLFETLTGEAPFAGWRDGPQALAHLNAPLPSPSELCPEVPGEFDDVVGRAMAKDPNERFASAGDLGQAALAAAGGQRQASPRPDLDTGNATVPPEPPAVEALAPSSRPQQADSAAARGDTFRWVIALAGLVLVAAGMAAALVGISSL
jgi:pSer/pThr/pTyr-binding forkhead associated (FHA) protein/tRNA A-37 threonylcarbamoyl transferase component Bud32